MFAIATVAPLTSRTLERVEWTRTYSDYPSDAWTVACYLDGPTRHEIAGVPAASPSTEYLFSDDAGELAVGVYAWQVWAVSTGAEGRRALEQGSIEILPGFLEGDGPGDATTHASRMLALIEGRIEGRLPLDAENYTINGRSLARIPIAELLTMRRTYRIEVRGERRAAQAGVTPGNRRRLRVAF